MRIENDLNKTLSKIYADLGSLQSAREQVEIVTKSSKDLTDSATNLLQGLSSFTKELSAENTTNLSQLSKSLREFVIEIKLISKKGDNAISGYVDNLKKQTNSVLDDFTSQMREDSISNLSQLRNSLNEFEDNITIISEKGNTSLSKYIESFDTQTNSILDHFSKQILKNEKNLLDINNLNNQRVVRNIEKQEQEFSKIIQNISDANLITNNLIEAISNYDIPNRFDKINSQIKIVSKENKTLKIFLFVIIGLLAVLVLGVFLKSV